MAYKRSTSPFVPSGGLSNHPELRASLFDDRRRGIGPALLALLLLAACAPAGDDRPLDVSVVGPAPRMADRGRPPLTATAALLADATAQGLVAFDAAGQVEPALAGRWIVADGGRSLIFRLADTDWPDGRPVTTEDVARRLRAAIGRTSRNPLKPITGAIERIAAVTPQVVDIRLFSPRPNLLQLLAQPEFAVLRGGAGAGPFSASVANGVATLRPRPPRTDDADSAGSVEKAGETIRLRGERAALAVARFAAGRTDAVTGGTFADLPIARAARIAPEALRFDPAPGMFGLVFAPVAAGRFLGDPAMRRALSMAVDRDALVAAPAAPGWRAETRLVGGEVDDLPEAARPDWAGASLAARRADAAAAVAGWVAAHEGTTPGVRIALPRGPGSRLLLDRLTRDWRAIGVAVEPAAGAGGDADLTLIDAVAPGEIASWYLRRFACEMRVPCSAQGDIALIAARNAPTLAERTVLLREADRIITATVPFIPLARPLRWSLVGRRLTGWRDSPRAFHPLRHLRAPRH